MIYHSLFVRNLAECLLQLCPHPPSVQRTLLTDVQAPDRLVDGKWTCIGVDLF